MSYQTRLSSKNLGLIENLYFVRTVGEKSQAFFIQGIQMSLDAKVIVIFLSTILKLQEIYLKNMDRFLRTDFDYWFPNIINGKMN